MTSFNPYSDTLFRGQTFKEWKRDMTTFDPKEFAAEHNLNSACLTWYGRVGRYEVTAWAADLEDFGCLSVFGDTIAEAISNAIANISRERSKPDSERQDQIARLKRRVAELEELAPTNDRNLPRDPAAEEAAEKETANG